MACVCRRSLATDVARLIRHADCPPVPWKNGAGTTRELWALRDAGGVLVRISIAEITGAQPFSVFPGTDRIIAQLGGPPMVLTIDGTAHPLSPLTPLPFRGEAKTSCALNGPGIARDLNLMTRRGAYRPAMRWIEAGAGAEVEVGEAGAVTALLALDPVGVTGAVRAAMTAGDLIVTEGRIGVTPDRNAAFVLLEARP